MILARTENSLWQTLVDSGVVFSDIAGSEAFAVEPDEKSDELESLLDSSRGRRVQTRRGRRGRGSQRDIHSQQNAQTEQIQKRRGRKKKKGRSKISAYAPD